MKDVFHWIDYSLKWQKPPIGMHFSIYWHSLPFLPNMIDQIQKAILLFGYETYSNLIQPILVT